MRGEAEAPLGLGVITFDTLLVQSLTRLDLSRWPRNPLCSIYALDTGAVPKDPSQISHYVRILEEHA